MGGNGWGSRGTGRFWGSGSDQGSGGDGGIFTVDASIIWAKMPPTTDPPDIVNGERTGTVISIIWCTTTPMNASSFKGSGAGASKTLTVTGSVTVLSPVVVVVSSEDLSPKSSPVEGQGGFRSVELETPNVYGDHLHVSSSKVEFCDNKIPVPTQCSLLRPNFHIKISATGILIFCSLRSSSGNWSVNVTCMAFVSILILMVYRV